VEGDTDADIPRQTLYDFDMPREVLKVAENTEDNYKA
jgi:hypothetical protein